MENYTLHIPEPPQRRTDGTFNKGHIPFNKGVPMEKWMTADKIEKAKKYLEIGRVAGNKNLAGHNKIPVVGVKDGKLYPFKCASEAERILRGKGIKANARNIRSICNNQIDINKRNSKPYVRKIAGGFRWFNADDVEKYKNLIN